MHIHSIDHLVLTVNNLQLTCEFYSRVLGMEVVQFGTGRVALHFGQHKINLHAVNHEVVPKARYPTPGSADLCLLTTVPLTQVIQHLRRHGVALETDIVPRTGAQGAIASIYIRDPDGNLLEISNADANGSMLPLQPSP